MTEYGSSSEKREDKLSIFHYQEATGMYKVLAFNPNDKNDGMFASIRNGVKGTKAQNLSLFLNKQEVAYVIMELTKLYNALK